jgi:hypothetical protein
MVTKICKGIKPRGKYITKVRKNGSGKLIFTPIRDRIILMIRSSEIEDHFRHLSSDRLDIILEIHRIVAEISPTAVAEIRPYGIVYYKAERGGPVSAGICQSLIKPDHIRLAFIHGAFLPDPFHLLQGDTFPKRFLKITSFDQAPWDEIHALIKAHHKFDPREIS